MQGLAGRRSVRFSPRGRAAAYAIVAATWLTGIAWLALHFFAQRQGEFGAAPHPLEPWSLKLHGASAFASLLLAGAVWSTHILPAWHQRRRPASGLTVAATFALLIATGYLLYYAGDDALRARVATAHWVVGVLFPLLLVLHVVRRRTRSRERLADKLLDTSSGRE